MIKLNVPLYILFLLSVPLVNCRPDPPPIPTNPYAVWNLNDPGLQRRSLNFPLGETWDQRAKELDAVRKSTLLAINEIDGISDIPSGAPDANVFASKLSKIRQSFPDKVNEQFDQYVFAVYFVRNLGSSGLTGIIRYNKEPIGGIIFIDTERLSKKANEWATEKEKTVFSFAPGQDLKVTLETDENNTIENSLAFILLHEFGHILATVDAVAPDFSLMKRDFKTFPYFKDFWFTEVHSEYDTDIKDRTKFKFYSKEKIPFSPNGLELYSELEDSPFVTLYSANNADDSFAEAYASYVHVILQNKPYEVHAIQDSESKLIFDNGINRSEGKSQREFLNKIFGRKE